MERCEAAANRPPTPSARGCRCYGGPGHGNFLGRHRRHMVRHSRYIARRWQAITDLHRFSIQPSARTSGNWWMSVRMPHRMVYSICWVVLSARRQATCPHHAPRAGGGKRLPTAVRDSLTTLSLQFPRPSSKGRTQDGGEYGSPEVEFASTSPLSPQRSRDLWQRRHAVAAGAACSDRLKSGKAVSIR
jgi:hypothetical protein